MWINEEHSRTVSRPGIPECWPAHPHVAHDLAVLACSRYFTSCAVTPAALEDWHRSNLPAFLERLRGRLGDGCQPGKHMARPRTQRDEAHAEARTRTSRGCPKPLALELHGKPDRTPPYPAVTTSSSTNAVEKAAVDMTMGSGTGANGSLEATRGSSPDNYTAPPDCQACDRWSSG
jgi:hypothetical protein